MKISIATLNALTPWVAGKKDIRDYLRGVYITKVGHKCRMTASNGCALATTEWEDHEDSADYDVIVPVDNQFKPRGEWADLRHIRDDDYQLSDRQRWRLAFTLDGAKYPQAHRCWPVAGDSPAYIPIDPALFGLIAKTCAAQKVNTRRAETWPAAKGLLFRAGEVRGYIAGLNIKEQTARPEWEEA